MRCRVKGCRFRDSHTTAGHICGTCKDRGHGQLECGNTQMVTRLMTFCNEQLPSHMFCDRLNCDTPWSHTKDGHFCRVCCQFGDACTCVQLLSRMCPTCKRVSGSINPLKKKFTGGECIICYESRAMVEFEECGHVNVCTECVLRLA